MTFDLVSPSPGSLAVPATPEDSDDDGQAVVQYTGPEDEAEVGSNVEVRVTIGGDA